MRTFFKTMLGLLLTLPVGAYFVGSYVASHSDHPANARLVRVDHNAAVDRASPADKTAERAGRPSRPQVIRRSGSSRPSDDGPRDEGAEHSSDREDRHWSGDRDHSDHGGGWDHHSDEHSGDYGWSHGGDSGGDHGD